MRTLAVALVFVAVAAYAGLCAAFLDWGTPFVEIMGACYIGYAPTLVGSLIGGVWAVVDGAVAGVLIALVYNKFASE